MDLAGAEALYRQGMQPIHPTGGPVQEGAEGVEPVALQAAGGLQADAEWGVRQVAIRSEPGAEGGLAGGSIVKAERRAEALAGGIQETGVEIAFADIQTAGMVVSGEWVSHLRRGKRAPVGTLRITEGITSRFGGSVQGSLKSGSY